MSTELELIMTICNQGYADIIMESAKKAGARGGTIIHGRGSASAETLKFFGLTIQPEKELLIIVTKTTSKSEIMLAITSNHGIDTKARGLCFSVPITDARGFKFD